jgi:CDP-diacylglycerol--glycerol-3-phosphate 3-phosphatidyltransferase
MEKIMNLANKLTMFRICIIPVFILLLVIDNLVGYSCALMIFIIASITDWYDGKIARARKIVTTWGKFIDPLADKMLVSAALISFVEIPVLHIPAWIVIIIICREFAVTGLRLVSTSEGITVDASLGGKIKTISQMISIIIILLVLCIRKYLMELHGIDIENIDYWYKIIIEWLPGLLIMMVGIITTITGIEYLVKYKGVLCEKNNN